MKISKVDLNNLNEALAIYNSCVCQHEKGGFNQWDHEYPSKSIVEGDIIKGNLFGYYLKNKLVALIAITKDEPIEYKSLQWGSVSNYFVIHRLCVYEKYLRQGIARKLMVYAENKAKSNGCSAIRLDTFSLNIAALEFYKGIGYSKVGFVNFPKRLDSNYTCFEKLL